MIEKEFNAGDKVIISLPSYEEYNEIVIDRFGQYDIRVAGVVNEMYDFDGVETVIDEVIQSFRRNNKTYYRLLLDVDHGYWTWDEFMLEKIDDCDVNQPSFDDISSVQL